jgi:hypothetical protein
VPGPTTLPRVLVVVVVKYVVILVLNLGLHHEDVWGSGGIAAPILASAIYEGGQLHAPAALSQGKSQPGTHRIVGSMGPRAGFDAAEERKNLAPSGIRTVVVEHVFRRYTD